MAVSLTTKIEFPSYSGVRCLMMPYIQGDPDSVPDEYKGYREILEKVFNKLGEVGYLTIDESEVVSGLPHRGDRAKFGRALHTEAGIHPDGVYAWGGGGWGRSHRVTLDGDVRVLLANNIDNTCALWDCEERETSVDGDIGDKSGEYPYTKSVLMRAGEVYDIGIFTPHESLPIYNHQRRQFLRIVSSGVHGREPYFTINPKLTNPHT